MNAMTQTPAPSRAATVQKVKTPGGNEVWLVEDYAVPLVAFQFAFKAGAAQDPDGKAGVANMLSGLLDEGAGPYDSEAFHRALDDLAVEISFHADHDNVHGQMKTLSRNIDKAFDLLRVAVCEPRHVWRMAPDERWAGRETSAREAQGRRERANSGSGDARRRDMTGDGVWGAACQWVVLG
jgi:predicted Zn-dependent peptidase